MQRINNELRALLMQMENCKQLKNELAALQKRSGQVQHKIDALQAMLRREERDVDRLSRVTLSSVWLQLKGTHEEVLQREQADVEAARLKCSAALQEREEIHREIESLHRRLRESSDLEERYNALLQQKRAQMDDPEIVRLEEMIAQCRQQKKELSEAIAAGGSALNTADQILKSLKSADGFATWDLLGGGMIADIAKHSRLSDAQRQVEELQRQLRQFSTELSDVHLADEMQVNVDGFLYVADFIFDGVIADWMVKDRIGNAQRQVEDTRRQISQLIAHLEEMIGQTEQQEADTKAQLEERIRRG